MELLLEEITGKVISAYFKVYNSLGYGFLEKVYENALSHELRTRGLNIKCQMPVKVFYDELQVGFYIADIIVEDNLIIEVKAAEALREEHECQLINYLRATDIEVGLLLNFGKKVDFRRKIFQNHLKKSP